MNVIAAVQMKNGRLARNVETTRDALFEFFVRNDEKIDWLIVDICLTRWFYQDGIWIRYSKFRYVPNRPDLWHVGHLTRENVINDGKTPFDHI